MRKTSRGITAYYALVQALYWITNGLMFSYASVFLLDRSFTNGQIGLVVGISYGLAAGIQPLIAAIVNRTGVRLSNFSACVYAVVAVLAACVLLLPLKGMALAAVLMCALTLQASQQATITSMYHSFELQGLDVSFSVARGVGSLAYSCMVFSMGFLLRSLAPDMIPALYLTTTLLMCISLVFFRTPSFAVDSGRKHVAGQKPLLQRHPHFILYLLGATCLLMSMIFLHNYMLQVMRNIGGDSTNQSRALAISSFTELPAMVIYSRLRKRVKSSTILRIASCMWAVKMFFAFLATSPAGIYGEQLLQFFTYAIYVPAGVDYIAQTLPADDFLEGQALGGSAYTLGSLLAMVLGGALIDWVGVSGGIAVALGVAVTGAVLMNLGISRGKRARKLNPEV